MNAPPADKPLALMHVCHSCFLLRTASGATVLLDPYFGGEFRWKGHTERHLGPPPGLAPADIDRCDGIIVTHDHPDHCQAEAIRQVMARTRCQLWGPAGIYRRAVEAGLDTRHVNKLEKFAAFRIGDLDCLALPNRGSEEAKPCMRMSYLFRAGGLKVFHGGDSHGPSPAWTGHVEGAELALLWPTHLDKAVAFIKPRALVLHHYDRFEPGDFLCGHDADELRAAVRRRFRSVATPVPARGEWFWPEQPAEAPAGGENRGRDRSRPPEPAPPAPPAPQPDSAPPAAMQQPGGEGGGDGEAGGDQERGQQPPAQEPP